MSVTPSTFAATPSQTVGPFFAFGLTTNQALGQMATAETPGDRIRLMIRVLDGDDAPVPDAVVELWHNDGLGNFLFGRLGTNAHGTCHFETVRPCAASVEDSPPDAAHINICLFMRGLLRHVYTRMYFSDKPELARDSVLSLVPAERRHTLLADPVIGSEGAWMFDIRLQGEQETVFFNL